jgi:predicted CXXCH cytochrome family protein
MKKATPLIIGGIFVIAIVVVVLATLKLKHQDVPEGKFKNMVGATYVGSPECKNCHERKYLEWTTTLHSKMMQDPKEKRAAVIGDFATPNKYRTFSIEDVAYIIGNKWNQMYLKKVGNDYEVLPALYNITENRWYPYNGDKQWFKECAGCHAVGVDPEKKTFKEAGVGCEACHGPGSNHIKSVPGFEIQTIVNPARLTTMAAAEICGSCHTRGADKSGQYKYPVHYMGPRGTYNLALHFNAANRKDNPDMFWPSGDAKRSYMQFIDWKQSEHAKAGITCNDCHVIHEKRGFYQLKLTGDNLCKSCHTTLENRMAHRIHTFGSCIACHMPKMGVPGEPAHISSHTFKFVSPELSIKLGGVKNQPNSCSGCHKHKDTPLLDLVEFLDAAKKTDMPLPFSAHRRPAQRQ